MIQFIETLSNPIANSLLGEWADSTDTFKFYVYPKENPKPMNIMDLCLDINQQYIGIVNITFTENGNCNLSVTPIYDYQLYSLIVNKFGQEEMKLIQIGTNPKTLQKVKI